MNKAEENILKKLHRLYPRAVTLNELSRLQDTYTARELAWHIENRLKEYVEITAVETSGNKTGMKCYRIKPELINHDTA